MVGGANQAQGPSKFGKLLFGALAKANAEDHNTIESGKDRIFGRLKCLGKKMQGKGKLVVSGSNRQATNPMQMMATKMATKLFSDSFSPKKFAADVNTSKDFNDLDKYLLEDNMTKRRFGGAGKNNTK